MSSFMPPISKAWQCMSSSWRFIGVLKPIEESNYLGYSKRGYITGNGKLGSKDEIDNGNNNSRGHRSFESGGHFQSQNHDIRGRKPTMSRLRVNSRKRGFRGGFRMPDFDLGKDQLKKIFESQMDISDPIVELDLGDGCPIEGNFRDDDD